MAEDRVQVRGDFTDVINQIKIWAEANLNLVNTEDLIIQATEKLVKNEIQLTGSIRGVNEAGEQQVVTLKRINDEFVAVGQSAKILDQAIKQSTESTNANTQAKERNIEATKRQEAAARAATSQRGQDLNVRNLLNRNFPVPAGATPQEQFSIQEAKSKILELSSYASKKYKEIEAIWKGVENNRLAVSTGTNRRLQSQLFALKNEYQKIVQAVNNRNAAVQKTPQLVNNVTKAAEKSKKATEGILLTWQSIGRIIVGQVIRRAFLTFIQFVRQSVDVADDFLIKIGEVQTISQQNQLAVDDWSSGLRRLSDAFGTDILDQTEAAYQTLSNQVAKGADTFLFLESANKLALATVSSTSDAVNALTAVLNSYNLGAQESEAISASLFKTVELGRLRLNEIANTIGSVTALASQLNISYVEVESALATLTIRGIKANQAMTQLRGIFAKLIKPTEEMKDLFREMGVASGEELISSLGGFEGFLRTLATTTEGSTTELGKYISRLRGLSGAAVLTSQRGLAQYAENVDKITNSTESFGNAVRLTTENVGKRFQIELNKAKNVFLNDFGIPIIQTAIDGIEKIGGLDNASRVLAKTITSVLIPASAALLVVFGKLLLANPFALYVAGAAAATLVISALIERTRKLREEAIANITKEAEDSRKSIEENISKLVKGAEKGVDAVIVSVNQAYASVQKSLNEQADASIKAFEDSEKSIKIILNNVRKNASSALQAVTKELNDSKKSIEDISSEITKLLEDASGELFQLDIADLDVGDQIVALQNAYRSSLKFAEEAIGAGQTDIVKRRLKEADAYFKQLKKLQESATKENIKSEEKRQKISEKIAEERSKFAIEERKLVEEIAEARRKGERGDVKKLERELAELRSKQTLETTNLTRELKSIRDIEFERVNLARQLIEATTERIQILEKQRKVELENQAALEKQRASLKVLTDSIVEVSKRVEKIDIKDFLNEKDVDSVNILLEDRRAAIDRLIKLSKDERLQTKLTAQEEERLLATRKLLEDVANQRIASLLLEERRRKVIQQLQEQKQNIKNLQEETTELQATRQEAILYAKAIKEALGQAPTPELKEVVKDLQILRAALESGVVDESVIKTGERLQKSLVGVTKTANAIAAEVTAGPGFSVNDAKEQLGINEADKIVLKEKLLELGRQAVLLSNNLRIRGQLFEKNQELIFQEAQVNAFLERVASAQGKIKDITKENTKETKSYADRVQDVELAWDKALKEIAKFNAQIEAQKKSATELIDLLKQAGQVQGKAFGGFMRFAGGGNVGTDTIPAMLSPGEFVVNSRASKKFFSQLVAMNAAGNRGFANGGNVTVGDVNVSMNSSGNESVDVARIGRLLKREIRRGTIRL